MTKAFHSARLSHDGLFSCFLYTSFFAKELCIVYESGNGVIFILIMFFLYVNYDNIQ